MTGSLLCSARVTVYQTYEFHQKNDWNQTKVLNPISDRNGDQHVVTMKPVEPVEQHDCVCVHVCACVKGGG